MSPERTDCLALGDVTSRNMALFSACGTESMPLKRETIWVELPVAVSLQHEASGSFDSAPIINYSSMDLPCASLRKARRGGEALNTIDEKP